MAPWAPRHWRRSCQWCPQQKLNTGPTPHTQTFAPCETKSSLNEGHLCPKIVGKNRRFHTTRWGEILEFLYYHSYYYRYYHKIYVYTCFSLIHLSLMMILQSSCFILSSLGLPSCETSHITFTPRHLGDQRKGSHVNTTSEETHEERRGQEPPTTKWMPEATGRVFGWRFPCKSSMGCLGVL